MKRLLWTIVMIGALCSCGRDEDLDVRQENAFKTYLDRNEYVDELPCDTLDGVWRVIENPRDGRKKEAQAVAGSEVEFYFEGYTFTSSINLDPSLERRPAPFFTNRLSMITSLGMDLSIWPDDPIRARLGRDALFPGLDSGMTGAYKGDSLLIFTLSEQGYGEDDLMVVSKNTPLVFRVFINDVR